MAEHLTITPAGFGILFEDGEPDPETEKRKQRCYRVADLGPDAAGSWGDDRDELLVKVREDGKKLTSVTTILEVLQKPGLMYGAEKVTIDGMLWLASEGMLPKTREDALEALSDNNRRFYQEWSKKADRGTLTHEELLAHSLGQQLADIDALPQDQRAMLRGAADWFAEHMPVAVDTEIMVASLEHGFAGRHDFFGSMRGAPPGNGLVDFKTTEKLPRYPTGTVKPPYNEHLLQLGGYEKARVESGYEPSAWHAVVRIDASGEHHTWIGLVDPQRFVDLIAAHRGQASIVSGSKLPKAAAAA